MPLICLDKIFRLTFFNEMVKNKIAYAISLPSALNRRRERIYIKYAVVSGIKYRKNNMLFFRPYPR
jgi:hypothetical protein